MDEAAERDRALARLIKALGSSGFPGELSHFVRTLAAFDNLIVIVYCHEQNPVVLYREFTDPVVYQHMDTEYVGGAYLLDPYFDEHQKGINTGIIRLIDIAPDQFKRTNYFNQYYKQTGLIDEIAIFAGIGPAMTITACFGKDRSSGTVFRKSDIRKLKEFETVLSTLVAMHWQDFRPNLQSENTPPQVNEGLREAISKYHGIRLTPRQAKVAMMILKGHSSLSIALHLGISHETVKVFRRQLYAKCNISSQAELFAMFMPLLSRLSDND